MKKILIVISILALICATFGSCKKHDPEYDLNEDAEHDTITGLEFTLSKDGEYYAVTGLGTYNKTVLKIPKKYKGKPVKEIGSSAFWNASKITEVVIPSSITVIRKNAFTRCAELTTIEIPDSVKVIETEAFSFCTNLSDVHIGKNTKSISRMRKSTHRAYK